MAEGEQILGAGVVEWPSLKQCAPADAIKQTTNK